jgi:uncharacterized protein
MKKILLLSDTHGYVDEKLLKYVKQADQVWHAGDIGDLSVTDTLKALKPLYAVYGNIDNSQIREEFTEYLKFKCEDVNVWITHIGGYPPKYNHRVYDELKRNPPDIFITGHSHILKIMPDKALNLLHINPGAIGIHGFHNVRTMVRFEIEGKNIKNLEVIEFKR